ncbi:MAG: nucleoside triphosphate pyrophosphatase [Parasphingorhabdus sp.]
MSEPVLVLASKSKARQAMLKAAGISFEVIAPDVDEDALKADGMTAENLASALADAKAVCLSDREDGRMILGGDQVLALEKGEMLDKPANKNEAKCQLLRMSGGEHRLCSAAAIAEHGSVIWRHVDIATMSMRSLSEEFVDRYVDDEWNLIRHCVGCYEIEGRGVQLFSNIKGSQFTIMGLPLLPLLDYLRLRGVTSS